MHIFVWPPSFVAGHDLTLFLSQISDLFFYLFVFFKFSSIVSLCIWDFFLKIIVSMSVVADYSVLWFQISCARGWDEVVTFSTLVPLSTFPSYYSHTYNEPLFFYILSFPFALPSPSPPPLTILSHHCSSLFSSSFLSPSGDPLQFPGDSGGAGEADVQRSGRRCGGLVWFPSCLPPLSHALRWHGSACVDGYLHWCSQGTPA